MSRIVDNPYHTVKLLGRSQVEAASVSYSIMHIFSLLPAGRVYEAQGPEGQECRKADAGARNMRPLSSRTSIPRVHPSQYFEYLAIDILGKPLIGPTRDMNNILLLTDQMVCEST
jgi:hypothetical protein